MSVVPRGLVGDQAKSVFNILGFVRCFLRPCSAGLRGPKTALIKDLSALRAIGQELWRPLAPAPSKSQRLQRQSVFKDKAFTDLFQEG
jgi:hypothetical protein